ncbi:MAG TPA: Spy/CpxP family protein refolding chaperone [Candidatus Sulfotelmatobacter sp.]|jgi:protein CpxP|nr:Spy/CpxP family protein refolding chaperone [Candidatus Sulfotelmatobacter sp.]
MKNKVLICALAAAILADGFTAVKTYAAEDSVAPARGKILQRIAEKLNLTDDQKSQIKTIFTGERDNLQPLVAAVHTARVGLRTAIRAGDATEASVRAASAKVAGAEADLAVERMKIYAKIAPVLTDAQRKELADMQANADEFADNLIARIGSD